MIILGIETATKTTSVALCEDHKILGQFTTNTAQAHSKTLLPMIVTLLDSTKIILREVDLFAVSCGPGSFTGVRIGMSVAKGFAVAGKKLIAVISTLRGLAENVLGLWVNQKAVVCAVIDARCSRVYSGIWQIDGEKLTTLREEKLVPISILQEELEESKEKMELPVVLVGDAALLCCGGKPFFVSEKLVVNPSAVSICKLARDKRFWCTAGEARPNQCI
jgi:tRNA threonylcarbamoyladenosine biosynthesis protein TsaB